ncbi:MAG: TonB-dependent receptor [Pseudomonadales bacterium]|nr:TonB-dependent receptor [Halioglobus sp.]MCP5192311.1 TonB-dependent receptor [Pseudomonadales bacterium]
MQTFRKSVLASAIIALIPAIGAPSATAQNPAAGLEEVVVTGTRKEGMSPTETLSPIDVISSESLTRQATFSLTESLTQIAPSLNTQRFPIADGTAFVRPVTLRNLSPDHTLVLVDGTRRHRSALVNLQLAPLGTVNQGSQGVDFASFPSAAIKRVEVLRDGASAQYGSDAIAGVVNVILKDADEGFTISGQYGEYDKDGDGQRSVVSANGGLSLGGNGFLNLTGEYATTDTTSRGQARPDAADVADIVGKSEVPYSGLGQRWGDPELDSYTGVFNTAYNVSENLELYGNGSYYYNETKGGFFYRTPVLPGDGNLEVPARNTLEVVGEDGKVLDASQELVNSITGQGLNPSNYLVPDASSPSGYILRNPIYTQFPGGYSPIFGADITDTFLVLGARGEFGNSDLSWDLKGRYGENEVKYNLKNSINPSLGSLSPTDFEPGTLTQEESGVNLDFVKTFDNNPANLGFGFEWRRETYKISTGDQASIEVGPTYAQFGVGSDGFQGFFPDSAGSWDSDSWATYLDLETEITDKLSGAMAMRYENFEEYGTTLDWKFSARYDFTDNFALRATANTGFRAPTPGQVHTLNVTTTADSSGNLIPSGTYPIDNPVAQVLGATDLENETSNSYTAGIVWTPVDKLSITVDYYDISIEDRMALSSNTISQQDVDELKAQGYPDAELLLDSNANYFTNGFDTQVTGVDLAITTWHDIGAGTLTTDMRHNHNKQEISNVKTNAIDQSRVYDLENQVPEDRSVLSFIYDLGGFSGLLRANYYGNWQTTPGLFGDGSDSKANTYHYNDAVLVDLELSYTFAEHYTATIGGQNIFDEYPDKEGDGTLQFLGDVYAVTSPFGFNGAFWYARVSASF